MESDTFVGVSIAVHIQGGQKTAAFSKRLNPFAWFLAHFNAVLFWSHQLSVYSSNSNTMCRHLAKVSKPGFAFDDCYGNFSIRCWAEPVWSGFWQQRCIDRREDRGRPRSGWTAANFVLVGDLICSEAWQKVSEASGISEWCRHLECVLQRNSGHQTSLCERITLVQSIFRDVWTEVRKHECLRKQQLFVLIR